MNAMETIHKLADSASKAIWGEHEEPVSGKMGNVAAGEPYDAGNIGRPTENEATSPPSSLITPEQSTLKTLPHALKGTTPRSRAPKHHPAPRHPEAPMTR